MKIALSNIALPPYERQAPAFAELPRLGIEGIEVAPSRLWSDTWRGLRASDVADVRRSIEGEGLSVVGLHSLFFDHPHLGLFKDDALRLQSLDFLTHLSAVCRDLGGRTLIWGGGRRRGEVAADRAVQEATAFMSELCRRIEDHGTVICFEPLGPKDTDFLHTAGECLAIVEAVNHRAMAIQLDAKALVANSEAQVETFRAVEKELVHFHANEPDLGVLGSSGIVDHAAMNVMLKAVGYDGWVSIEQRQLPDIDPLAAAARSAAVACTCYA